MATGGRRHDVLPGQGERGLRSRRGGGCHLHSDRGKKMKERRDPGSAVLMLKTSPKTPPEGGDRGARYHHKKRREGERRR